MASMNENITDPGCFALSLPPPIQFPIDGYGGSYYDVQFPVPVYSINDPYIYRTMSWHDIDSHYSDTVSRDITNAIGLGISIATLINVAVLTPRSKRKLPSNRYLYSALVLQVIYGTIETFPVANSLLGSSYVFLTNDLEAIRVSRKYIAIVATSQILACLIFMLVQACFFIQGRGLMTWLRLHHRYIYYAILGYLVCLGATATGFRIGLAVTQIMYPLNSEQFAFCYTLLRGTSISYGGSIGSWSSIFFVSALSILIQRRQTLHNSSSVYDTALKLVTIIGLESFIVPVLLCILRMLYDSEVISETQFTRPDQLIMPSVLFLLPLSSLFLSTQTSCSTTTAQAPIPAFPGDCDNQIPAEFKVTTNDRIMHTNHQLPLCARSVLSESQVTVLKSKKLVDRFDIELAEIDAEHNQADEVGIQSQLKQSKRYILGTHTGQDISAAGRMRSSSQLLPSKSYIKVALGE